MSLVTAGSALDSLVVLPTSRGARLSVALPGATSGVSGMREAAWTRGRFASGHGVSRMCSRFRLSGDGGRLFWTSVAPSSAEASPLDVWSLVGRACTLLLPTSCRGARFARPTSLRFVETFTLRIFSLVGPLSDLGVFDASDLGVVVRSLSNFLLHLRSSFASQALVS